MKKSIIFLDYSVTILALIFAVICFLAVKVEAIRASAIIVAVLCLILVGFSLYWFSYDKNKGNLIVAGLFLAGAMVYMIQYLVI